MQEVESGWHNGVGAMPKAIALSSTFANMLIIHCYLQTLFVFWDYLETNYSF